MRNFAARCVVALTLVIASTAPSLALALFQSETQAQQHCPSDVVVWLNLPSGIYHLKGQRYYANTKRGAYVCKKEADAEGDREDRNGQ
jgi:hypothetical protein